MIICACVFLIPNSVGAKDNKFYVGINGLYAWENLDDQQTKDKFSGPITVDFDNTWGVQLRAGYVYSEIVTVEAMVEYIAPFEAMTGSNKDELDVKNLIFNAKITCPAYKQFVPYAIVGLGIMNAHEDISFNGAVSETSDWGAGFRAGLGLDYHITDSNWSIGFEGAYSFGTGDVDHIRYTTISVGVAYYF